MVFLNIDDVVIIIDSGKFQTRKMYFVEFFHIYVHNTCTYRPTIITNEH